ncbi:MAG: hypothetical protein ACK53Y_13305, partial [bacterium]
PYGPPYSAAFAECLITAALSYGPPYSAASLNALLLLFFLTALTTCCSLLRPSLLCCLVLLLHTLSLLSLSSLLHSILCPFLCEYNIMNAKSDIALYAARLSTKKIL